MNRILSLFVLPACFLLCAVYGCNQKDPGAEPVETATTGKATILCDESIIKYMRPTFAMFDSSYPEASVSIQSASAREAMAQLFAGKARGIIVSRQYLLDEDSLMKVYKVQPHASTIIAQDALVFFTGRNFPADTLSVQVLKTVLTDKSASFMKFLPQLKSEPVLVCPETTSSEYGNVLQMMTNNKPPQRAIKFMKTVDSVRAEVLKNPNAIGIGYLSNLAADTEIKMLKIGFQDTTGVYVKPKTVHQSYIVMGKYPFIVKIQGLLLEDRHNLPWGYMTFLRNDTRVKQYLLRNGIVPEGARFNLIPEEE